MVLAVLAATSAFSAYAADAPTLTLVSTPPVVAEDPAWVEQVKHPTPWLTWGADERLRYEAYNNATTLNQHKPGHEAGWGRFRTRLWASVAPCKEFEFYGRLNWEWRAWVMPESKPDYEWNYVSIENLYTKIKPMPDLTLTIGRQDIIKGDGWLILEGTPLDGSTTIFFDAIRAAYDVKAISTVFELMYLELHSEPDDWIPTINDDDKPFIEQNERGAIFYVTNNSLSTTQFDGYFIYKHDERVQRNGDQGDIYTLGGRVQHNFNDNLTGRVEGAGQWGSRNGDPLCAFGANSRLTYGFNDAFKNALFLNFEYLSGDDPGTGKNEAFDPLWGRWPQFSELYVFTYAGETRVAETTNLVRVGPGYTVQPCEPINLEFTYQALFANENTYVGRTGFSDSGSFRGHLFTGILRYKMNKHLSAHLWSEFFMPGDYYDQTKGDNAIFLRAEVVLTF